MNKEKFILSLKERNIDLDNKQLNLFDEFYQYLIEENKKYNLTAITEENQVYEKHFYDSLSILFNNKIDGTLLDVGAGAGFPSIPLAIANKNLKVSVLDSTLKRMNFINSFSEKNRLNIDIICSRAEEYKANFDYVTARGVAQLNILLELCCNLVKENGILIAMKGSSFKEELLQAQKAIKTLGFELIKEQPYCLPTDNSERCNLYFKKVKKHDSKYPRAYSQIKNKPL